MKFFISLLLIVLFLSCGRNSNDNVESKPQKIFGSIQAPEVCSIESKKEFVFNVMHDSYLWESDVKEITVALFNDLNSSEDVLNELIVDDDRFSNIITLKQYNDLFEVGVNSGFGYFPSLIEGDDRDYLNVDFIYPNSPASSTGLKRGDLVEYMDGNSIYSIRRDEVLYDQYIANPDENMTVLLKLKDSKEINITKAEFSIDTVLHHSIIDQDQKKIGYLVFDSFISKSYDQLESVFKEFNEQNIDELVLDLRYNGGGIADVANYLSSMIGGDLVAGKVFNKYLFNDRYYQSNSTVKYKKDLKYSLNLSRVFIITTQSTASASELVINSLSSNNNEVEVIQIGSTTYGKPYGMIGGAFCDKYILPIQFKIVNSEGLGDYAEGIVPTCQAIDDISREFGDTDESSLFAALYYIQNGSCEKFSRSKKKIDKKHILKGFDRTYGLY